MGGCGHPCDPGLCDLQNVTMRDEDDVAAARYGKQVTDERLGPEHYLVSSFHAVWQGAVERVCSPYLVIAI